MYGIRVGPLVMATMAVILVLYGILFVGQGRLPLGLLALLAAAACAGYLVRVYARSAAERRARARERERAFVEGIRRG
jgi:hypothetical protein